MELFDLDGLDQIPQPVAPVRPISKPVGPTIPVVTSSGITGKLDSIGNIFNDAGAWLGNLNSTPMAKIPGTPPAAAAPGAAKSSTTEGAIASLVTLEKWAAGIVSRSTAPETGISLEDIVLIVLGVLLLAGALFSFKETKTVVQNVTKNVRGAADKAIAAQLAA